MGRIISFLNFKGGVGKTSCVVNLGACLSLQHGKRVLVVDLDAQCNSTFWLLRPSDFEHIAGHRGSGVHRQRFTTYQIFRDALMGTSLFQFEHACIEGIPLSSSRVPEIPLLHLLPGAIELLEVEHQVTSANLTAFLRSLQTVLLSVVDRYDYILIDCPPHLFRVTEAALAASHDTVIPYNPDFLSLSGFKILCRLLREKEQRFQALRPKKMARHRIAGMILNRFERRGLIWDQARAELVHQIELLKQQGEIDGGCILFDPPLRSNVHIAEASSEHKPVILHSPDSIGSEDFTELARNFIHRFEGTL